MLQRWKHRCLDDIRIIAADSIEHGSSSYQKPSLSL